LAAQAARAPTDGCTRRRPALLAMPLRCAAELGAGAPLFSFSEAPPRCRAWCYLRVPSSGGRGAARHGGNRGELGHA
jgi:hypothetical protein